MNELQRMQYLDALGIDTFVPRLRLPHAQAPRPCQLPVRTAANAVAAVPSDVAPQLKVGPQVASDILARIGGATAKTTSGPNGTATAPSNAAEPAIAPIAGDVSSLSADRHVASSIAAESCGHGSATPVPKSLKDVIAAAKLQAQEVAAANFSLGLWQLPHIHIVDSRHPGDALPTEALLANILRAHGMLTGPLPAQDILNWPIAAQGMVDQGWPAAHDMVVSYMEGRLDSNPAKLFLIFGEDALRSIVGDAAMAGNDLAFDSSCFCCIHIPEIVVDAIVLPSLRDVLRQPLLKAKIWSLLVRHAHTDE